jgi:flagellar hook-associated protein 3 FlgL
MTSIGTSAFYNSAIYNMNKLSESTGNLQQQIDTGNRLTHSYDDPVAAAQMRTMQAQDSLAATTKTNTNAANTALTLADSTLDQFNTVVSSIQTLATQAANGTLNPADKANVGKQIAGYYQQLVSLANTKDSFGNSIFSGTASGPAYTTDASGNATYAGSGSANPVSLGGAMSVTPAVTGPEIMNYTMASGQSGDLLSSVKALADGLQNGTLTADQMNAAGGTFDQLSAAMDQITTTQTVVGTRLSWITTAQSVQTSATTQRSKTEANVGGTDLIAAAAQLAQQSTILDASQASFTKLASLSLFNYMK